MFESTSCVRCETPVPADAPQGVCPACLLRVAVGVSEVEATPADPVSTLGEIATGDPNNLTIDHHEAPEPNVPVGLVEGYVILSELGRGGMGVVYKARHVALDRVVALKLLRGGGANDQRLRERFAAEARALARLRHVNIVQVFEVGECDSSPFLAMEYVDGGSLAGKLREDGPLVPIAAARMVETLAEAVAAAHRAGILHRDIKPANVLLDAGFEPKVTDFGLAKMLDVDDSPTVTGAVLGTPAYMAPEQAAGMSKAVGPETDVYALGATLYELLTGRPPFKAETPLATAALVVTTDPVPPRSLRADVPLELEAICLKCLEKARERRYATAGALATDLGRFLSGDSTVARPLTRSQRAWRWLKRRRWPVGGAVAAVLISVTVFAITWATRPTEVIDPDEVKREKTARAIEDDLAAGKPVTLIGKTGLPKWHRWALAHATLGESPLVLDYSCSFVTPETSLLELARKTPPAYRLTAELRHDIGIVYDRTARGGATTGVYVMYRKDEQPDGSEGHSFLAVEFNERWGPFEKPEEWKPFAQQMKNPPPHGHSLAVACACIVRKPGESASGRHGSTLRGLPFTPQDKGAPPWRTITVEVTPERVRVSCLDDTGKVQTAELPDAVLRKQTTDLALRTKREIAPSALGAPIGIISNTSMISVRNVVLEPIPSNPE